MSKVDVLSADKITLEQLAKFYIKMGYSVSRLSLNNKILLELSSSSNNIDYIVYLHLENTKLDFNDVNDIIYEIKSYYSKQLPVNYMIISIAGYDNSSKNINGDNLNIYELEKINIRLEDDSYVEDLIDMYNKNSLSNYLDLYSHNKVAYKEIKKSFNDNKRVCIAHATGTGKSALITKCIEDFKDKEILVLSSSNYILDYFSNDYNISSNNIKLMTYYKLSIINEFEFEDLIYNNPKLIILDEYHRCGAPFWNRRIVKLLESLPNAYVLGTSATPIRYLDEARDMSKELFDGNIVSSISLYDAIARNILPMPKYVVALYDFIESIDELESEIDKSKNTTKEKVLFKKKVEVLKNINDSSKYIEDVISKHVTNERNFIVFCKDIMHMRTMIPIVKEWFDNVFDIDIPINIYELYSGNSNSSKQLNRYLNNINSTTDSFNILFTIDMLNEGIHAKKIDGVILLRPTTSGNIYYQQIGRALSVNTSKTPLIFDFVDNASTMQTTTFFESIKNSIKALPKEIQSDIDSDLEYIINNIYDETKDTLNLFKEIEQSLKTSWDYMYGKLVEYYNENGHTLVKEVENKKLSIWVKNCRSKLKNNTLEQSKIDKLNQINFVWNSYDVNWKEKYNQLKEFKITFGHTNVSKEYDNSLYLWIIEQKNARRNNRLEEYKINKLNDLDFIWNLFEYTWDTNYQKLVDIKNYLGHLNIAQVKSFRDSNNNEVSIDSKFRKWLTHQKRVLASGEMRPDKAEKFRALGVEHEKRNDKWNEHWKQCMKRLVDYKTKYGDLNVQPDYEDKTLRNLVLRLRDDYKNGLAQERIDELNNIGFIWSVPEYMWEKEFNSFKKNLKLNNYDYSFIYKEEFSDSKQWSDNQIRNLKDKRLSQEKIDKLNSINFIWDRNEHSWNTMYSNVEKLVLQNGPKLPNNKTNPKERAWLYKQKALYKKGTLKKDRLTKLINLGYKFD